MPRGGRRPGAGRKPGSVAKKSLIGAARAIAGGLAPIDIMLQAARSLFADGKYTEASLVAARVAPYIHQRFAPTDQRAKPHDDQGMLPLFSVDASEGHLGKKQQAQVDAERAGSGSDWGDDLKPPSYN